MGRRSPAILSELNQKAVNELVKVESRNREVHMPPVSVYRWWARRTEAVNGAILDVASKRADGNRLFVADPFAGGGIIPMSALRRGHAVYAQDLNPWVTEGLSIAMSLVRSNKLQSAADVLLKEIEAVAEKAYGTVFSTGESGRLSHTFRVAVGKCPKCVKEIELYPHALVSRLVRKDRKSTNRNTEKAFVACRNGHLHLSHANKRSRCPDCHVYTKTEEVYLPRRISTCPHCGTKTSLERIAEFAPYQWRIVLVERSAAGRREIAKPTRKEINQAEHRDWACEIDLGIIAEAHETRVLTRHGFRTWGDLYPKRQAYVIHHMLEAIDRFDATTRVKNALRIAVWGTCEMAGHVSRWDRHYLKSYESMASHRFNFTTFTAEPNVIGLDVYGRGSFCNRIESLKKASDWLTSESISVPFRRPVSSKRGKIRASEDRLRVVCGSSERMLLTDKAVDLILTDPPYHDDVQYHELSLPLRAWARLPLTRGSGEAVAIPHLRDLEGHRSYRDQLVPIFEECARILKPTGRMIFSYANRETVAWVNLFAALKTAKLHPLAFTIVRSENETEVGKSSKRSCHLDLIMELSPVRVDLRDQWHSDPLINSTEETFLMAVGSAFLRSADLVNGWEDRLVTELNSKLFVSGKKQIDSRPNENPSQEDRALQSESALGIDLWRSQSGRGLGA